MSHVRDRWMIPGPSGRKVRSERWGRGDRWQARWIEDGRERGLSFASKDAAEAHLAQIRSGGTSRRRSSLTVGAYAVAWQLEQLHYARSTAEAVRKRLGVMVLPALGGQDLRDVTRGDVQRLVVGWAGRYSPSTVHQGFSFLSTMFGAALRDGLISVSPCVGINLPSINRARITPLTSEQVATIAGRVAPRYRSMVIVGAATGLRQGELRGLTVDRIIGGDVVVDRQLASVDHGWPVFEPPKSKAGFRRVALGLVAGRVLAQHLEQFEPGREGIVWTTREHGPVDRKRAGETWVAATQGMGMRPRSGWHELRHHHASLLIAAGMSPRAVADRLGHADASETLKVYAHLWPTDSARMTDAVDAALALVLGPSGTVTDRLGSAG